MFTFASTNLEFDMKVLTVTGSNIQMFTMPPQKKDCIFCLSVAATCMGDADTIIKPENIIFNVVKHVEKRGKSKKQ